MDPLYLPSELLTSSRVIAGFSTRAGGDDEAALAASAGLDPTRLFMVTQVHGRTLVEVGSDDRTERICPTEADALVTTTPGTAVAVRTADCVPVLLADPAGSAVAAAHAGWRGLVAGVIEAAVEAVVRRSGLPSAGSLVAAIGPAIDHCCFEVGEEVAEEIVTAVGTEEIVHRPEGAPRPYVDLRGAARLRLRGAGLLDGTIELVGPCTRCASDLLHSYRRDGPRSGRQVSFVAPTGNRSFL